MKNQRIINLLLELIKLSYKEHYVCDDCWYSCPMSEDGCCNDDEGGECNCGAVSHNIKVDEFRDNILAIIEVS